VGSVTDSSTDMPQMGTGMIVTQNNSPDKLSDFAEPINKGEFQPMSGPIAGKLCSRYQINPRRQRGRYCLECHRTAEKKRRCKQPETLTPSELRAKIHKLMHGNR